jgi:hypothetical protein
MQKAKRSKLKVMKIEELRASYVKVAEWEIERIVGF